MENVMETRNNIASAKIQQTLGELIVKNSSLEADVSVLDALLKEAELTIKDLTQKLEEKEDAEKLETERKPSPTEESVESNVPKKK